MKVKRIFFPGVTFNGFYHAFNGFTSGGPVDLAAGLNQIQDRLFFSGMALLPVFGKAPSGGRLERIQQSANYGKDHFQNAVPTEVTLKGVTIFKMLREYRNRPVNTRPNNPVPSVRTDLRALSSDMPAIVWFGHSSYLLKIKGLSILVDPVFSGNASPVSFFAKAFPGADIYGVEDLPEIDMVVLTHDHYDHLDYKTILQLAPTAKHFYTSLGVGAHLEFWGIPPEKITELDWWETAAIPEAPGLTAGKPGAMTGQAGTDGNGATTGRATLTATPSRHFSGRGTKRGGTLWSSFVLKIAGYTLFLGGDSGYEEHFKKIGDLYGPFDLAILEAGQYGKNWPYIHMLPEQTVMAAKDLRAKVLLPVHWAKFTLALHPWNEPIQRVVKAVAGSGITLATPMIGEPVVLGAPLPQTSWWEQ
ncbi:MAG TPA: MBL fold metallo-hydrolase [Puia sp.]